MDPPNNGHNANPFHGGLVSGQWNPASPSSSQSPPNAGHSSGTNSASPPMNNPMELDDPQPALPPPQDARLPVIPEPPQQEGLQPPPLILLPLPILTHPLPTKTPHYRLVQQTVAPSMKAVIEAAVQSTVEKVMRMKEEQDQEMAEDADDESTSPGTKRKKSKTVNMYHGLMRDFLALKKLALDGDPPHLPSAAEISGWVANRTGGPSTELPRFDWTKTFSHAWNDELLGLLAQEFLVYVTPHIKPDQIDEHFLKVAGVKDILASKLRLLKRAFLSSYDWRTGLRDDTSPALEQQAKKKDKALLKSRHKSRMVGTFARRKKIIKYHVKNSTDPAYWNGMEELLIALGLEGMSSDETENEAPAPGAAYARARKLVRRRAKRWLNADIALLWQDVEAGWDLMPEKLKRGNPPYPRIPEARASSALDLTKAQHIGAVKNLPINWYDSTYWILLTSQSQQSVSSVEAKALPQKTVPAPAPAPAIPSEAGPSA
ncbi:hypothetical protein FA13DRAFT_1703746 [Coprinellus micaceus]|uniref:Uncharacterized protein n=1 Tax=Coprinellus micaceus TaxID=71717 RepID=A0A4Y7TZ25_COPMI|nr:hypothetical protein FA13DRAFT_1703746 [Coprinellus micaceus]